MTEKRNMLKELQEMGWTAKDIDALLQELKERFTELDDGQKVDKNLQQKLTKLLIECGIPFNIKGASYLREAITYVIEEDTSVNITKELYPHIAKEFETTSSRVERAIRHAVEKAFNKANPKLNELFGYTTDPNKGKPSNGEFIAIIAEQIKQNLI